MIKHRISICKDKDVSIQIIQNPVYCVILPFSFWLKLYANPGVSFNNGIGVIGGTVSYNYQVKAGFRIIQLQAIPDFLFNNILLVIGSYHQCNFRKFRSCCYF